MIYQVFPRSFSSDEISRRDKTAECLCTVSGEPHLTYADPIHPSGELKRKIPSAVPNAVRDYFAIDPALGIVVHSPCRFGEFLIVVNLSNTPFRGSVEAGAGNWRKIALPLVETGQNALPAVSIDSFKFRIFQRQTR